MLELNSKVFCVDLMNFQFPVILNGTLSQISIILCVEDTIMVVNLWMEMIHRPQTSIIFVICLASSDAFACENCLSFLILYQFSTDNKKFEHS